MAKTPKTTPAQDTADTSAETIPVPKGYERAMKLSSGKVVAIRRFKGADVMEIVKVAQASKAGFNPADMLYYVIAYTCLYDGQKLSIEALREIDGFDLFELMAEFQGKV